MLRGQAILTPRKNEDGRPDKGSLWPMPKDDLMRPGFSRYERDAFAGLPKARSDHYQAAKAIYAAKSADEGDSSGILDPRRWEESIKLATGGIDRHRGKSIVLPYGMDYPEFRTQLQRRIQAIVDSTEFETLPYVLEGSGTVVKHDRVPRELTISRLSDMPLANIGDGRYVFRVGDGILVDKAGKPVIVDFNTPAPLMPHEREPTPQEIEQAQKPATMKARRK